MNIQFQQTTDLRGCVIGRWTSVHVWMWVWVCVSVCGGGERGLWVCAHQHKTILTNPNPTRAFQQLKHQGEGCLNQDHAKCTVLWDVWVSLGVLVLSHHGPLEQHSAALLHKSLPSSQHDITRMKLLTNTCMSTPCVFASCNVCESMITVVNSNLRDRKGTKRTLFQQIHFTSHYHINCRGNMTTTSDIL